MAIERDYCFHCGSPATLLCDYVLGVEKVGRSHPKGHPAYDCVSIATSEVFTCDRPLCEKCAINKGATYFCGEAFAIETMDYCRGHAQGGGREGLRVITRQEAKEMQSRLLGKASDLSSPIPLTRGIRKWPD